MIVGRVRAVLILGILSNDEYKNYDKEDDDQDNDDKENHIEEDD